MDSRVTVEYIKVRIAVGETIILIPPTCIINLCGSMKGNGSISVPEMAFLYKKLSLFYVKIVRGFRIGYAQLINQSQWKTIRCHFSIIVTGILIIEIHTGQRLFHLSGKGSVNNLRIIPAQLAIQGRNMYG